MMPPMTLDADNEHLKAASFLANYVDEIAGGYPLVSGLPGKIADGLLWQYGAHYFVIIIRKEGCKFPSADELKKGSPSEIELHDLDSALEFIRLTESIRQNSPFPYIMLGRMPSTKFM